MSALRNGLRRAGRELPEDRVGWAGIPMPLEDERLVVNPRFPNADALSKIGARLPEDDHGPPRWKVRNEFHCSRRMLRIVVAEDNAGRITWGPVPAIHSLNQQLRTLGCSDAWGLEQEQRALQLLGTLVRHRQFKQYLLTGCFLERSPRSGVHYLFRKLRPTVAMHVVDDSMRVMCALCLHPIAYYAGSWAGAMCPTDDVVAHLMLMRGDEHRFWKQANQHPAWAPEAGL